MQGNATVRLGVMLVSALLQVGQSLLPDPPGHSETTAQVLKPEVDMAVGIVGSILISALLYVLMSLCICTMQASPQIDLEAPFAAAFSSLIQPDTSRVQQVFLATSARFVSFGALTGELVSSHCTHPQRQPLLQCRLESAVCSSTPPDTADCLRLPP